MTKYEELSAEYEDELFIEERLMINKGLYADNCVWINKKLKDNEKCCILAEEIGHYHTTAGDILDQSSLDNQKQELKARRWAYEKLLPVTVIIDALDAGYCTLWELAEHLEVDEAFLKDALRHYGILDT